MPRPRPLDVGSTVRLLDKWGYISLNAAVYLLTRIRLPLKLVAKARPPPVIMHLQGYHAVAGFLLGFVQTVSSDMTMGRPGHGLIGYGISMYHPACAYACQSSITNPLNCSMSTEHGMESMNMRNTSVTWMVEKSPNPECYANNDAFLQTLAYCMYSHCHAEANSTLQRYWEMNVAGSQSNQPLPKESYQQALWSIGFTPNTTLNSTKVIRTASFVSDETYMLEYNTLTSFERGEITHETYGYIPHIY